MPSVTLEVPSAGQVIASGLHAANYADLQALLNGGLDQVNFASGKIFDNDKIMQDGALLDQAMVWDGSNWSPANVVRSKYKKVTSKTVTNTVASTDLLNGEITVAANALRADGILRFEAWGTYIQNSGSTQALLRMNLALGGTSLIDTNTVAAIHTSNGTANPWRFRAVIQAQNATNAQFTLADFWHLITGGNTSVTLTTGSGLYWAPAVVGGYSHSYAQGHNTTAKDMTSAQALTLNVVQPVANASVTTVLQGATVEIL